MKRVRLSGAESTLLPPAPLSEGEACRTSIGADSACLSSFAALCVSPSERGWPQAGGVVDSITHSAFRIDSVECSAFPNSELSNSSSLKYIKSSSLAVVVKNTLVMSFAPSSYLFLGWHNYKKHHHRIITASLRHHFFENGFCNQIKQTRASCCGDVLMLLTEQILLFRKIALSLQRQRKTSMKYSELERKLSRIGCYYTGKDMNDIRCGIAQ